MTWTDEKDFIMLTAMAGEGVFDAKVGSRERGSTWKSVAASLNCHSAQGFNVNQRSVRDRFNILAKRLKESDCDEPTAATTISGFASFPSKEELAML